MFGPSDVYGIKRLTEKDTILMRGAVTATMDPDSSLWNQKMSQCNLLLGFILTMLPMVKRVQPFVLPWELP